MHTEWTAGNGFRAGDIVLQLEGHKVHSVRDLLRLTTSSAGKTAQVAVYREQRRVFVEPRAKNQCCPKCLRNDAFPKKLERKLARVLERKSPSQTR